MDRSRTPAGEACINSLVVCKKNNFKPFDEQPAYLQLGRVREGDPFQKVGVDFADLLYVRPFNYDGLKRANSEEPIKMEKYLYCLVRVFVH